MLEKQRLLNTYVNNVTLDETLDEIDGFIRERGDHQALMEVGGIYSDLVKSAESQHASAIG